MLFQDNGLDIQKVMEYPLGPVPWSSATSDGMPIKTNKAVLKKNKLEDVSVLEMPAKEKHHAYIMLFLCNLSKLPEAFGE